MVLLGKAEANHVEGEVITALKLLQDAGITESLLFLLFPAS